MIVQMIVQVAKGVIVGVVLIMMIWAFVDPPSFQRVIMRRKA